MVSSQFRNACPEDDAFLFELYGSTRADELAPFGWDADQTTQFLRLQYIARQRQYIERFPSAEHRIILVGEVLVGRLLVDRSGPEIRLVDIALLPEYRGQGIGGALVSELISQASTAGRPVTLHVGVGNRAIRFYERLGFVEVGNIGSHLKMEWRNPVPLQSVTRHTKIGQSV